MCSCSWGGDRLSLLSGQWGRSVWTIIQWIINRKSRLFWFPAESSGFVVLPPRMMTSDHYKFQISRRFHKSVELDDTHEWVWVLKAALRITCPQRLVGVENVICIEIHLCILFSAPITCNLFSCCINYRPWWWTNKFWSISPCFLYS